MACNGRWGEFLHQLNMAITTALQGLTFCYIFFLANVLLRARIPTTRSQKTIIVPLELQSRRIFNLTT